MKPYSDITKIIHKEGYTFIAIGAGATFVFASINVNLGWLSLLLTVFCAYFFRNPQRVTPTEANLVVSPGDGLVVAIDSDASAPAELNLSEKMLKISIFLDVFNVHVNRIPVDGKIVALHYNPGKFFNASLDKASIHNERQSVLLETAQGQKVAFIQIAGLIARRIVCDLEEGMQVKEGSRYGIIRFGSRVDVFLPAKTIPTVALGQTVIGGETILADLSSNRIAAMEFEVR
jgi:phosphatidylserine decarboxylase